MDISSEDRDVITMMMVIAYAKMGYNDNAKALAEKQNSIIASRESLLPKATEAEERDKYQGEAIIALLTELKNIIVNSICTNIPIITTSLGTKLLVDLAHLYESVFSDGKCGIAHYHISELYLHAAIYEARFGDGVKKASEYFRKGFEHIEIYKSIRDKGEYHYTAPLVSKVTFPSENFPAVSVSFWKGWVDVLPDNLKNYIKDNSQYSECFE